MLPYLPHRISQIGLSLAIALSAVAAHATAVTGTVGPEDVVGTTGYAANITGMTYVTGGTGSAFGGSGVLFCTDAFKNFPSSNSVHTYNVVGFAGQMDHVSAAARGEDYLNWIFDNYYASVFLTPNGDNNYAGYAFNLALWEIRHDYDGTQASLNTTTGKVHETIAPLYLAIVNGLKTTNIAQGYRSTDYTLTYLNDQNTTYQSMVMLTDAPAVAVANAVPEPSSLALSLIGGLALWNRRRNRARPTA